MEISIYAFNIKLFKYKGYRESRLTLPPDHSDHVYIRAQVYPVFSYVSIA